MSVIADLCASPFYAGLPSNDYRAAAVALWRVWSAQQAHGEHFCHRCHQRFETGDQAIISYRSLSLTATCSRHVAKATIDHMQRAGWIDVAIGCERKCLHVRFTAHEDATASNVAAGA